jgi:hypothetical protein
MGQFKKIGFKAGFNTIVIRLTGFVLFRPDLCPEASRKITVNKKDICFG